MNIEQQSSQLCLTSNHSESILPIRISDSYFSMKNDIEEKLLQKQKKIKKEKKKCNRKESKQVQWTQIQLPFSQDYVYPLIGHILIEVYPKEFFHFKAIIQKLEKSDNLFSIYSWEINTLNKFEPLVYMLENSQSQQKYDLSQILKQYSQIVGQQLVLLQDIINDHNEISHIFELVKQRKEFKLQFLHQYLKQNLSNDDFYLVCNVGTNIQTSTSHCDSVHFSKAYYSLLGIDEELFSNMFFRKFLLFTLLPIPTREIIFMQFLQAYLSNNPVTKIFSRNFEIKTLDQISIVCNVEKIFLKVEYPEHLRHPKLDKLHYLMDNINITIFDITEQHIKKIIDARNYKDLNEEPHEDFEYSMFSQIFLEKYYPNKLSKIEQEQNKAQQQQYNQAIEAEKRCSYKVLNNHI